MKFNNTRSKKLNSPQSKKTFADQYFSKVNKHSNYFHPTSQNKNKF